MSESLQGSPQEDVFAFSALSYWLASVTGAKLMVRYDLWSEKDKKLITGMARRVSKWHTATVIFWTERFVKDRYNPPNYSKVALSETQTEFGKANANNSVGTSGILIELHARMLVEASKDMLHCWGRGGVCAHVKSEMEKWFNVMDKVKQSTIYSLASQEVQKVFSDIIKIYHHNKNTTNICDTADGHPFFNHMILFIFIAYQVCFHIETNYHRLPKWQNGSIEADDDSLSLWEHHSGLLLSHVLQVDQHGIHLEEKNKYAQIAKFTTITLPYKQLFCDRKNREKGSKQILNCPTVAHEETMTALSAELEQSLTMRGCTKQEQTEILEWNRMTSAAKKSFSQQVIKVNDAEKQRNHYEKEHHGTNHVNNSKKRQYIPNMTTKFERDVFLFGQHSPFETSQISKKSNTNAVNAVSVDLALARSPVKERSPLSKTSSLRMPEGVTINLDNFHLDPVVPPPETDRH